MSLCILQPPEPDTEGLQEKKVLGEVLVTWTLSFGECYGCSSSHLADPVSEHFCASVITYLAVLTQPLTGQESYQSYTHTSFSFSLSVSLLSNWHTFHTYENTDMTYPWGGGITYMMSHMRGVCDKQAAYIRPRQLWQCLTASPCTTLPPSSSSALLPLPRHRSPAKSAQMLQVRNHRRKALICILVK